MALWKVSILVRDAKRKLRPVNLHVNNDSVDDFSETVEFVQEYALAVDSMITGQIVDINISQAVPLPAGLKTVPSVNSDVQEGALFVWLTGGKPYPVRQRIPTFDETLMQPGTRFVDLDDAAVIAFRLLTIEPIETPAEWSTYPVDRRNINIARLKSAEEDFEK